MLRSAEIIAVGSELLTPHRTDTDSLFLTSRLNDAGIVVRRKVVVGDSREDLADAVASALSRADLVITTGGLGPTDDDLTREAVADVLGLQLDEDPSIVASIAARFARRGSVMPEINRRQALVPRGATVFPNPVGTAPGLLIQTGERLVVLFPGPPRELTAMFDAHFAPRLAALAGSRRLQRRVIKIIGRAESEVDAVASPIYTPLASGPLPVETTILASAGQIELHLSAAGDDDAAVAVRLDAGVIALAEALAPFVFSTDGRSLEAVVGSLLDARGWRVALAESCTGGLLAGRLTDVPGSSGWVVGGVVAYANDVKVAELGVPAATIDTNGAVSEPVARAMAEGARDRLHANVGIGITGIAGPDGGTPEKPVGTVVIAVAATETLVRTFRFSGDRELVRRHSTSTALDMLRRLLLDLPPR
ncbi:MAG TPA: competence/damage-inducible protein A [Vicinamibacterales bacterium]|nr:competence/damage-inducible protein A [Vicinamibacterales bacterium]